MYYLLYEGARATLFALKHETARLDVTVRKLEYLVLLSLHLMAVHSDDSLSTRVGTQNRTAIAFLVLTWFFISLRVWTRTYVIANFGWDDSTMILAGVRKRTSRCMQEYSLIELPGHLYGILRVHDIPRSEWWRDTHFEPARDEQINKSQYMLSLCLKWTCS